MSHHFAPARNVSVEAEDSKFHALSHLPPDIQAALSTPENGGASHESVTGWYGEHVITALKGPGPYRIRDYFPSYQGVPTSLRRLVMIGKNTGKTIFKDFSEVRTGLNGGVRMSGPFHVFDGHGTMFMKDDDAFEGRGGYLILDGLQAPGA
jgi:hypothetical protein